MSDEQRTLSRREQLIAAIERIGIPEAVRRIESIILEPCGDCHLQPGEVCDICGGSQAAEELLRDGK